MARVEKASTLRKASERVDRQATMSADVEDSDLLKDQALQGGAETNISCHAIEEGETAVSIQYVICRMDISNEATQLVVGDPGFFNHDGRAPGGCVRVRAFAETMQAGRTPSLHPFPQHAGSDAIPNAREDRENGNGPEPIRPLLGCSVGLNECLDACKQKNPRPLP